MREMQLPAGERTRILWLFSSSVPGSVRFRAEAVDGGPPDGTVELLRRRWFSWETVEQPLAARNVLPKGFTDADYRVFVTPSRDTRIVFESRHFRAGTMFLLLGALLVLGLVAGSFGFIVAAL